MAKTIWGTHTFIDKPEQNPPYINKYTWFGEGKQAESAAREIASIGRHKNVDGDTVTTNYISQNI